mgnify:CR=1 FL=1
MSNGQEREYRHSRRERIRGTATDTLCHVWHAGHNGHVKCIDACGCALHISARTGMLAASPTGGSAQSSASIDPNRLVIGREVKIKGGKITSCDRLTLEGEFEDVNLSKAQLLEVAPVGVFKGKAEVDEAVIGGRFEGDLTAHNRLTIKDGGSISGIVRYGSIVIEPGGSISGEMQTLTESGGS